MRAPIKVTIYSFSAISCAAIPNRAKGAMMKRFARTLTFCLSLLLVGCGAPEGVWPVTTFVVPAAVQALHDEHRARDDFDALNDGYFADGDLDIVFPLNYFWIRQKDPLRPYAVSLQLLHTEAVFLIVRSDDVPWASVSADGGIETDMETLKLKGQEGLEDVNSRYAAGQAPIPLGDAVFLPVGAYTGYAVGLKRAEGDQTIYYLYMLWSTQDSVYVGMLAAYEQAFAYAYAQITQALEGFKPLSQARPDAPANVPPLGSTTGLLPDLTAFPMPEGVKTWYEAYNAQHGIGGDAVTAGVYASEYNDMTLAVPAVWDMEAKPVVELPVEGQMAMPLLADKSGNTVISISSYPSKVDLVRRDADGSVSFDAAQLDDFAVYMWNGHTDGIVSLYREIAPEVVYPFEYVGEGLRVDIGRHTGYLFPYKGTNDGHAYGAYIMWNTGTRQYTCTVRADGEYFLFALAQACEILNSFEYYLRPAQRADFLGTKGY